MSSLETIARPYAKAIFEIASDEGSLQVWLDKLIISSLIVEDVGMKSIFDMPSILPNEHVNIFLLVYEVIDGKKKVSAEFKNFISLLAENGRLHVLSAITKAYEALKQESDGQVEVLVTSARVLNKKQNYDIAKSLAKKLGKEVCITSEVDETLIGGAIVRAGDLVIDGSVLSRLRKLSTALKT